MEDLGLTVSHVELGMIHVGLQGFVFAYGGFFAYGSTEPLILGPANWTGLGYRCRVWGLGRRCSGLQGSEPSEWTKPLTCDQT